MAFEEKRRLSQGLGSLAGDKLGVVMEIIAETQPFDSVRRLSIQCSKQDNKSTDLHAKASSCELGMAVQVLAKTWLVITVGSSSQNCLALVESALLTCNVASL